MRRLLNLQQSSSHILEDVRRQILQITLKGMAVVVVLAVSAWLIFQQGVDTFPRISILQMSTLIMVVVAIAASYILSVKWRTEPAAAVILIVFSAAVLLNSFSSDLMRSRGIFFVTIPIVLASTVLPSRYAAVFAIFINILSIIVGYLQTHAIAISGSAAVAFISVISYIGALSLETVVSALEVNLQARQGAQEALRRRLSAEQLIGSITLQLVGLQPSELDSGLRSVLQSIGKYLDVDRCYISQISADGSVASLVHDWHSEVSEENIYPSTRGTVDLLIWSHLRFSGEEGLAIDDVLKLADISDIEREAWNAAQVRSVMAMPMMVQDTLSGFIACDTFSQPREWTDDNIQMLKLAAGILSNVLVRGRVQSDLLQNEERLKLALSAADLGIYNLNLNTGVIHVDERYQTMLGYNPRESELRLDDFMNLVHPDDRQRLERMIVRQRMTKDRVPEIEYRVLNNEGEYRWILDRGHTVRDPQSGEPLRITGTRQDVTARKQMETEINAAETRYRNLVEHLPAVVYLARDSGMVYVSPQIESILGYTQEEYLFSPNRWRDFIHSEDFDLVSKAFAKRNIHETTAVEYRATHKDGHMVWLHDESTLVADKSTQTYYIQGILQDITERIEIESTIRESQTNLALAQQIAGVGGWNLEVSTGQLTLSEDLLRQFGATDRTDLPTYPETLQLYIHPDYWPSLQVAIDEALAGGPDVDMNVRMYMPGDIPFFVHMKSTSVRDRTGKVVRLVGMIQDITERIFSEEAFQTCLANLVLTEDVGRMGTWMWDVRSQIFSFSERSLKTLALERHVTGGLTYEWFLSRVHPDDRTHVDEQLQATITQGADTHFLLRLVSPNEGSAICHMAAVARRDTTGAINKVVGVIQNISSIHGAFFAKHSGGSQPEAQ